MNRRRSAASILSSGKPSANLPTSTPDRVYCLAVSFPVENKTKLPLARNSTRKRAWGVSPPHGARPSVNTPVRISSDPSTRQAPYPSPRRSTPSIAPTTIPASRAGAT